MRWGMFAIKHASSPSHGSAWPWTVKTSECLDVVGIRPRDSCFVIGAARLATLSSLDSCSCH